MLRVALIKDKAEKKNDREEKVKESEKHPKDICKKQNGG